jgi:thymidylate synthase (FAD)
MLIVKPKVEIIDQEPGLFGIYKQIEFAGRICYKSHDKITDDSAEKFVSRMINSNHGAVLEHGTVYLIIPKGYLYSELLEKNHYSRVVYIENKAYITTNYRVIIEEKIIDCLQYMVNEPTIHHELRVSVLFNTQIAISREANRSRSNSICEESTRFCDYTKEKFNNQISISLPTFIDEELIKKSDTTLRELFETCLGTPEVVPIAYWLLANKTSEFCYQRLIQAGWQPQEARTILPLDTKTEFMHTAYVSDWQHFFNLRSSTKAHNDIKYLSDELRKQFSEKEFC